MTNVGKTAKNTGKKQDEVFTKGTQKANKMSNSLDRLAKKWLSIGGAITLVSSIVRRAFARVDELTGLNRMAQSAGVAQNRIYSLGRALKQYGGDAASAASTYTSLNDILGGARAGKGISDEVVSASARYGISLNGGMLSEEQLMTNIARAMQAQRKKGNMYGVRDIASAFGIDEAMMLHLSQKGANWDRGLPAANMKQAQAEAQKTQQLRDRLNELVNQFLDVSLPLINDAMQALLDLINWLKDKFGWHKDATKPTAVKNFKPSYEQVYKANKSIGMSDEEAKHAAMGAMISSGQGLAVQGMVQADLIKNAQKYADYANSAIGIDMSSALKTVQEQLSNVPGTSAKLAYGSDTGLLKIVIEDKAGVLRNMYVTGSINGGSSNVAVNTK
ncbi:MAG: hypothetical protein UHM08_09200 [Bacteroidales bacterium]|nr:hypothetical protein [Bacteroidales bacterium]